MQLAWVVLGLQIEATPVAVAVDGSGFGLFGHKITGNYHLTVIGHDR